MHGLSGERLAKKVDGTITEKYLWSGVRLLAIYNASDVLQTRFKYAGGRTPIAMVQGSTTYYLSYDQVGSLRAMHNAAGTLQGEITYDSFGNELTNTIPLVQQIPIGFAGGYSDRDTGLVRFGYRDYDPDAGRWTAKDPVKFAGGQDNLYVYCNNNPVLLVDPWGLEPCPEESDGNILTDTILPFIMNHGALSLNFSGGFGFGGHLSFTLDKNGLHRYVGVGLGMGLEGDLVAGLSFGDTLQDSMTLSGAGGSGPAIHASATTSAGRGQGYDYASSVFIGIGVGAGAGGVWSVGSNKTLIEFPN